MQIALIPEIQIGTMYVYICLHR